MKKIFYLSTCSTCSKIIKELKDCGPFELQDIKTEALTEAQLNRMAELTGSYEALFSRKAVKYKSLGLKEVNLSESDYKKLILEEYTFLKRPVIIKDDKIFMGNSKTVVEAARAALCRDLNG